MPLKFEDIPEAIGNLTREVSEIKRLLLIGNGIQETLSDQWLDINELRLYLPDKPTKATIYSWVNKSLIPVHKSSKKLQFLKSEIDDWLKTGRKKTLSEIKENVDLYFPKNIRKTDI